MIDIKNGKISFIEQHLFEPKIKDFDEILKRYKNYEVNLFLHIISDPSCRYESGVGSGRTKDEIHKLSAKDRFLSLLENMKITANAKGFYANKIQKGKCFPDEIKSTSFAYCNRLEVSKHFDARQSEYGIVFFHDFLQSNGITPVRYINEEDSESIRRLVFNEPFSIEAYGRAYDMRWEKEWRINRDLAFSTDDVAFIIVPDTEYHYFIEQNSGAKFDYFVLPSSVFKPPLEFFLCAHKMDHHAWHQIRLYGEWKVDFEIFPELSLEEESEFMIECEDYLHCLAKAEIQDVYENRYISRFMRFASSLNGEFLEKTSFKELGLVSANAGEPYETHRDLMMHCYTRRFEIQRDRINM
ncbi:MAG: hypothetical protein NTZ64_10485 [Polaromonas sp.]|nr:hypothetical protein [Polaromonas sp.]